MKEEQVALPPLGLLSTLARHQVDEVLKRSLPISDRLKAELPKMLEEHESVVTALKVDM